MESTNNNVQNEMQTPANLYGTNPYIKPKKTKNKTDIDFTNSDYVFMAIFAAISVCLVFFGFCCRMALGFTLSSIALVVALGVYIIKNGKISFISVSSLVLSILSSFVFTLYSNDGLSRMIAFVVLFVSSTLCAVSIIDSTVADNMKGVFKYAYAIAVAPLLNIAVPITTALKNDSKKTLVQVLCAFFAAIPLLAILISILVSADAAFEGLVDKMISISGGSIIKLIFSAVIFVFVFSFAVSCKFKLFNSYTASFNAEKARILKAPFVITFLALISFVYFVYMFSQTAYFFSAFSGILPEGFEFTFAEYARRGFFETEIIAFINIVIMVLVMWLSTRDEKGNINVATKGLLTFIGVFSILFIITAISKMVMYINAYGFTDKRLFTSVFMIATTVVITAFILRIYKPELNTLKYAAVISMALFIALSLCGIDRVVASYNVNAYLDGRLPTVDIETLRLSSDSARPYLVKLATECEDITVKEEARRAISNMFCFDDNNIEVNEEGKEIIRQNFEFGADFTLSRYLAAKSINDGNIERYVFLYEDGGDIPQYETNMEIEDENLFE